MKEICINENEDKEITLAYADDVAVITVTRKDLQEAVTRWNNTMERMGMKMNIQKTVVMDFNKGKEKCNIYILKM